MGRKTMKMERIENEKTRVTTFKKRKTCLLKKAKEFSTLCGVDACLIIYGPTPSPAAEEQATAGPETWPADRKKVHCILRRYKDTASSSCRKTFQIHDFLSERGKTTERNTILGSPKRAKYHTWDEKLGRSSMEELCQLLGQVEDKIHIAQDRVSFLASQKALYSYNYNQQLLPWPNLGLPVSCSHDPVTMESITTLMMLSRHNSYGYYSGPEAHTGPHWTPEHIVLNGSDQFPVNRPMPELDTSKQMEGRF